MTWSTSEALVIEVHNVYSACGPSMAPQLERRWLAEVPVMDYVYKTWIRNHVYPIRNWSIFMCSIRKTNNMEGWHINLSSRVSSRGPVPFYLLLTEMFKEANDLPMTLRLVTESKLRRYQRRKTRQTHGRLFNFWTRYCDRK
jgi:hypothetical protein